jgi:hypothetical protein
MKKETEALIRAMEYHVEQTRPIHSTTVAIQAAREAVKAMPEPAKSLPSLRSAIANDAWAISFQSIGQYRTALLKLIDATPPAAAAPAQRKPLTLEAIRKLMPKPDSKGWIYTEAQIIATVRQVEAAHRITEKGGSS